MFSYIKKVGKLEIISFIVGFSLMAFELVASRVLAPTIGSSLYVWTSVIGVIIAALSAGYMIGGKIADQRVATRDIAYLLLLSALSVILAAVMAEEVLNLLLFSFSDQRIQGLLASLILFAPTGFLMGVISPYLARLRIDSKESSGESVALLSALNSLGGISGTFLTGFVFFGYIGTMQAFVVVAFLLLGASWLVEPQVKRQWRIGFTLALLAVSGMIIYAPLSEGVVASINTPSSAYKIIRGDQDGRPVNYLLMGPAGVQSGVYTRGDKQLVFDYTRKITEVVEAAPAKDRILMLGGGAFTIPDHLAAAYPKSRIDVVEIDPQLHQIAKRYFRYSQPRNVSVVARDARTFLNKNTKKYDIVIVDVYSDASVPFALTTIEYARQLQLALNPDGIIAANMIASNAKNACGSLFRHVNAAYSSIRPVQAFYPLVESTLDKRQNVIAVYGNKHMDWLPEKGRFSGDVKASVPFSDRFAPVERLETACRNVV